MELAHAAFDVMYVYMYVMFMYCTYVGVILLEPRLTSLLKCEPVEGRF